MDNSCCCSSLDQCDYVYTIFSWSLWKWLKVRLFQWSPLATRSRAERLACCLVNTGQQLHPGAIHIMLCIGRESVIWPPPCQMWMLSFRKCKDKYLGNVFRLVTVYNVNKRGEKNKAAALIGSNKSFPEEIMGRWSHYSVLPTIFCFLFLSEEGTTFM